MHPAANAANEDKGLEVSPPKDDDPDGTKLVQSPEPLERAAKALKPLVTLVKDNIEVWLVIYDVAVRRGTYLRNSSRMQYSHSLT